MPDMRIGPLIELVTDLRIVPIPFGSSNYTYLIMNESCNEAIAVDLGELDVVFGTC